MRCSSPADARAQAVEQLLEVEGRRGEKAYGPDTLAIGIARLQVGTCLSRPIVSTKLVTPQFKQCCQIKCCEDFMNHA